MDELFRELVVRAEQDTVAVVTLLMSETKESVEEATNMIDGWNDSFRVFMLAASATKLLAYFFSAFGEDGAEVLRHIALECVKHET